MVRDFGVGVEVLDERFEGEGVGGCGDFVG